MNPNVPIQAAAPAPKRGCCNCWTCGCLALGTPVLLVLLLVGWVVVVQTDALVRVGLARPVEERYLGGAPDRDAAQALEDELVASGFSAAGLDVAVLPVKDHDYNLAAIVLDASQGFQGNTTGDLMLESLTRLATGPTAAQRNIGRIAVHYVDEQGRNTLSLTATTADIQAFASGQMSREAFLKAVEGKVDLQALYEDYLP